MYILPAGTERLTERQLREFIEKHKSEAHRYTTLGDMYKGEHEILRKDRKEEASYKPDNRLVANFAKYITDTFTGYFIGIPVKVSHPDDDIDKALTRLGIENGIDDHNAELAKTCSIYGTAYELLYTDEDGEIGITSVDPSEAFVIYDDSLIHRPLFGVRYYTNTDGELEGSYSTDTEIIYFDKEHRVTEIRQHFFGEVPLVEFNENEEGLGTFEPVKTLIDAYDKAISEKANDVDYFTDAYLKILGPGIDEKTMHDFRQTRLIHAEMDDPSKAVVEFLAKPDADANQEHLIDRLETLIYQISMVANINDDTFGNTSGIALAYKLLPMSNLAMTKERKMTALFQKRYKMIANSPAFTGMNGDDWIALDYRFTRNSPKNLLEESQIAGNLAGITSEETQLSVLSIVQDPKMEMEKKEEEQAESLAFAPTIYTSEQTEASTDAEPKLGTKGALNGAQTQSLLAVVTQYQQSVLTKGQAAAIIAAAIGVTETEAEAILEGRS